MAILQICLNIWSNLGVSLASTPEEFWTRCIERIGWWIMKMIKGSIPKFLEMTLIPVVMIPAWKEWCEQAALVQSDLYGYGMLESLRDCVEPPEPWRIILLYLMSGDVSIVRWRILNTLCMYYFFLLCTYATWKLAGHHGGRIPPPLLWGSNSLLLCSTIPCIIGEGARLVHQKRILLVQFSLRLLRLLLQLILAVGAQQQRHR
jgi:hypothetical protein